LKAVRKTAKAIRSIKAGKIRYLGSNRRIEEYARRSSSGLETRRYLQINWSQSKIKICQS